MKLKNENKLNNNFNNQTNCNHLLKTYKKLNEMKDMLKNKKINFKKDFSIIKSDTYEQKKMNQLIK